ncbi:MAG: N-acetylneuraminic acid synthase [Syntrophomonadaceae bacterium]|nr:N-acetylneuraminic acid synthase [Syntrophomonadaceae bacterium]
MQVKFIAEVSSNHNQNIERSLEFIDKAAEIGCSAVKFQLFKIEELFAPEILEKSKEHRERKKWELPVEFLPILSERCKESSIMFSCTPFYLKAVEELYPYVDFYKIASYELLWDDLLKECAYTKKPMVLSTGMATIEEVAKAVEVIKKAGCTDLTLLHCVSGYPTPLEECNLQAIQTLRENFQCEVGWSDHSILPAVIYRAISAWQARMIEFHLDLDRQGAEYAAGHCWLPEEIQAVIQTVRDFYSADGDGVKLPVPSELADREWRADPTDGLRPLLSMRRKWKGEK